MRALAIAAALALFACATVPQEKMTWAEALGAEAPPPRPLLAMNGRGLPAQLPHYALHTSIVSTGTGGVAVAGSCPFTVNTTTSGFTVACDGTVSVGATITLSGASGINLANSVGITNAAAMSIATGLTASNVNTLSIAGNKADGASAVGVSLNNATTLANAGAKLVSIQNNGTERAYYDVNGMPFAGNPLKPVPAVTSATAAQALCVGTQALTAGAATVTFSTPCGAAFSATPVCTCTDQTAANAPKCSETSTTLTIAGTSTDVIAFNCVGNR